MANMAGAGNLIFSSSSLLLVVSSSLFTHPIRFIQSFVTSTYCRSLSFLHSLVISISFQISVHLRNHSFIMMPPITFLPPYTIIQPFPQFYVFRPDQRPVPLVALDELPSWLQVGNWDWNDPSLFQYMFPASLSQIARLGEYDVICHHCCSNLEVLHKSISQHSDLLCQNNGANDPSVKKENRGASPTSSKSFPGAYCTANREPHRPSAPMTAASYVHLTPLRQPPFHANLHAPLLGMYLAGFQGTGSTHMEPPQPAAGPSRAAASPSRSSSSNSSLLNPGAREFTPAARPKSPMTPPTPPTPPMTLSNVTPITSDPISDVSMPCEPPTDLGYGQKSDDSMKMESSGLSSDSVGSISLPMTDSSPSEENSQTLLVELKKALGIKDRLKPKIPACGRTAPMSQSLQGSDQKPFGHSKRKRKRRRRRAAKRVTSKRPGRKRVVFKKRQGSVVKGQKRKEKLDRAGTKDDVPHTRYWHMKLSSGKGLGR